MRIWLGQLGCTTGHRLPEKLLLLVPRHNRSFLAETCSVKLGPHQHMLLLVCRLPEQDLIQAATQGCVHLMLGEDV